VFNFSYTIRYKKILFSMTALPKISLRLCPILL